MNGPVLLANLFFLFWLSLIPFVVRWVGEAGITRDTVLAFGVVMLLDVRSLVGAAAFHAAPRQRRRLADREGRAQRASRARSRFSATSWRIAVAFVSPITAIAIYVAVALMWLVPDKRFEALID